MSRRRGIEALQNLAIALLAASALLLVLLVVSYESGRDGRLPSWQELFPPAGEGGTASASDLTALSAPVDIVVTNQYGRGSYLLTADDPAIKEQLTRLLQEALGSAGSVEAVTEDLFRAALDAPGIYSTVCNDYEAMYDVARHLIDSGRKDILYLYTSHSYSGLNKVEGYKNALSDHHIPVRRELIHQCAKDVASSRKLMEQLADSGLTFDAVMTSDDSLAVGAVKFAHIRGISVPDELAIVGYNNSILSYCTNPEISSVDTKVEELCTTTVNTLMSVFGGGNAPAKTTIAADFIQKQTTNF